MTTTTDTTPLQTVATDALRYFEVAERTDGTRYVRLTAEEPTWVREVIWAAHNGELPNDWRWLTIHSAFEAIARGEITDDDGAHEFADTTTDPHTVNLLRWLTEDIQRIGYVEDARHEFAGPTDTFAGELMRAQYLAIRDTVDTILNALRDQLL